MNTIERIFVLLKEKGLQQKDLANKIKVTPSTLSEWKNGRLKPALEDISKIADYFNVSTDYLLGRTDDYLPGRNNINTSHIIPYDGEDPQKQRLAALMQDILESVTNKTQLQQIEMFLETYKK